MAHQTASLGIQPTLADRRQPAPCRQLSDAPAIVLIDRIRPDVERLDALLAHLSKGSLEFIRAAHTEGVKLQAQRRGCRSHLADPRRRHARTGQVSDTPN